MNDQSRVLIRKGARNLTAEEIDLVKGGMDTLTACTADPDSRSADGDASIGEC